MLGFECDILERNWCKWFRNKLTLVTALKLSPVGRGYEVDGWPTANIVLKVHTLFFLFFFFFFAYYVVLLLTVYWKADLALFWCLDLEKDQNKEQIWPGAVRLKIIILRTLIQSWNFADFDLHICGETGKLGNLGFRQCKTIIIPLIISNLLFLCLLLSALPLLCESMFLLLRGFLLTSSPLLFTLNLKSAFSLQRSSVENLPGRGFGATCCACLWHNSVNVTHRQTQFARLLSLAHKPKINRDHCVHLVSSNRENFAY